MSLKAVFFDLDGTLLPMDQEVFVNSYFSRLAKRMVPYGFEPEALIQGIWFGTRAMVKNDGTCTNEDCFWTEFPKACGETVLQYKSVLDDFYAKEFQQVQQDCGFDPRADQIVKQVKSLGLIPVLATNPFFPSVATESRIRWAGLDYADFALVTTYENSCFSKPNLNYYKSILQRLNLSPEEVLMVGNDVDEDMIAAELGMKVFLLTDCLINKSEKDLSAFPQGSFDDLQKFLNQVTLLPKEKPTF